MIINGKEIAGDIFREVQNHISHMDTNPHLTVFTCAPNFETQKYLKLKCKKAQEIGVRVNVIEFPENITTEEVVTSITQACIQTDGIIVQLPFPKHVDIVAVLNAVPASLDVDGIHFDGTQTEVLPPVVGAIREIAKRDSVQWQGKKVVVLGKGRLVGAPAAKWCEMQKAHVTVLTAESTGNASAIREAEVLILGAGKVHIITPDMITNGVAIFDAGTSEDSGVLKGDADPSCAAKSSLFTPVPGGIGPITIAILFKNLLLLTQ